MSRVDDVRAELAEITAGVQEAIRQRGHELLNIPRWITVRPGYRFTDGTITNDPVVATYPDTATMNNQRGLRAADLTPATTRYSAQISPNEGATWQTVAVGLTDPRTYDVERSDIRTPGRCAAAWWKQNGSTAESSATSASNQRRGSNHD